MDERYHFTRDELGRRLQDTIGLFLEYRDRHGCDEEIAAIKAVSEVLEGMDARDEGARLGREAGLADVRRILGLE